MNITSAQYNTDKEGNNVTVACTINGKNCTVPMDTANTEYAAILEWVAEGNTIQDAD
jgi:hypothetical protein|tara:strand:+ start:529 stop:699 length:171 start_codon:yes stop_codon:yes gene_type:complete